MQKMRRWFPVLCPFTCPVQRSSLWLLASRLWIGILGCMACFVWWQGSSWGLGLGLLLL